MEERSNRELRILSKPSDKEELERIRDLIRNYIAMKEYGSLAQIQAAYAQLRAEIDVREWP